MANEELWGEFAVGALFICLRFFARIKVVGVTNLQLEDLFMLIALLAYTAVTIMIHLITVYGATIGQTSESVYLLPKEMVASFVIGQKLTFADWLVYLIYIWSLKATLLVMFSRLTKGLRFEERILKCVIGYTAVAFVGAALSHICVCLPVHKSWQVVPYPGDACALRNLNYYLVSFFNASSDLCIIAIPVPIIFKAKIPVWRRALLTVLLCSGIFVVVATILRSYYSLKSITTLPVAAGWTSRETFVAAVAVSIPGIKPLFSRSKWFKFRSTGEGGNYQSGGKGSSHELRTIGGSLQTPGFMSRSQDKSGWRVDGKDHRGTRLSSDVGSEEIIFSGPRDQSTSSVRAPAPA
ncbi:unnamed protein product [Clonostachys byssicola]|uniref:Rhodopsin domain-containing protein n=1 Tax=Clonostachys byssicola TaxID=160290 RepID=A0A9N9UTC3_9HYPO|nr:unnamed protein product [Clonostachys byssicola]